MKKKGGGEGHDDVTSTNKKRPVWYQILPLDGKHEPSHIKLTDCVSCGGTFKCLYMQAKHNEACFNMLYGKQYFLVVIFFFPQ